MKCILALFALLLVLPAVSAEMAPLTSFKNVVGNGKYLLVMLYPDANAMNKDNPLHQIYPKSGLYLNDGSREPIWTLEGAFQGQVFLSADGDFLANVVFPTGKEGDGVRFFHKGKLLRAHKVQDLTRPSSIQEACPSCIWHGNVTFNEAEEAIVLEAHDGRIWHFDLRTGNAVSEWPLSPRNGLGLWWIAVALAAVAMSLLLVLFSVTAFFWWRANANQRRPQATSSRH